jgi:hypothetical protein
MGPIRCPETSVNNYHTTPRNVPEERSSNETSLLMSLSIQGPPVTGSQSLFAIVAGLLRRQMLNSSAS